MNGNLYPAVWEVYPEMMILLMYGDSILNRALLRLERTMNVLCH